MKVLKDGSMRYSNVRIQSVPTPSFPDMVQLVKGPTKLKSLIGKKYIDIKRATLAIDAASALNLIGKEGIVIKTELAEMGLIGIDEL